MYQFKISTVHYFLIAHVLQCPRLMFY